MVLQGTEAMKSNSYSKVAHQGTEVRGVCLGERCLQCVCAKALVAGEESALGRPEVRRG